MTNEYVSLEEKIAKNLSQKLGSNLNLSELETAKIEYGLSTLLVELIKLVFIYAVAAFLQIVSAVIVTHVTFFVIRRNSYGYHASKSWLCTIQSVFLLVIVPFGAIFFDITIGRLAFLGAAALLTVIIGFKGPAIDPKRLKAGVEKTRMKAIVVSIVILFIGVAIPSDFYRMCILLGMTSATILLFIKVKE